MPATPSTPPEPAAAAHATAHAAHSAHGTHGALAVVLRATLARALYDAHTRRAELQQLMGLPLDQLAVAMAAP